MSSAESNHLPNYGGNKGYLLTLREIPMKKSLRLLFATLVMAATVAAAASSSNSKNQLSNGTAPVPMCPPGVCAIN